MRDRPNPGTTSHLGVDGGTWLVWFLIGVAVAVSLQYVLASSSGGWSALLLTGEEGPLRHVVEEQLGAVETIAGEGHDGQTVLVVALDPDGGTYSGLAQDAALRWRRIIYPLLAGLGGLVTGQALLFMMIVIAAVGFGMATAAAVDLAALLGRRRWTVVGILANLGMWLAAQLLTPDALAIGFALVGVTLYLRGHVPLAAIAFALAVLTKEQYVLIGLSIAALAFVEGRKRDGLLLAGIPIGAFAVWSAYVTLTIGPLTESNGAFSAPFVGLRDGLITFPQLPGNEKEMFVIAYALFAVAIATTLVTRSRLIRYLAAPWLLSGLVLSREVWQFGNNPLRVLMPLWLLIAFVVDELLTRRVTEPEPVVEQSVSA